MVTGRSLSVTLSLSVAAACAGCVSADPAPIVRGPLATRIQHPLALTTLGFRPRRAAAQPEGTAAWSVAGSYANLYSTGVAGVHDVRFDGELASVVLGARYGLGGGADLELELPVSFATGGFLDELIEEFHGLFSLPNADRELDGTDQFDMSLSSNGQEIYGLREEEWSLGDVPIVLSIAGGPAGLDPAPAWRSALRFGVELPTGSETNGFGNGGVDVGAALALERSTGRWSQFLGLSVTHAAQPAAFEAAGVRLNDAWEGWGALELRASDTASMVLQLLFRSPLTSELGVETLDDPILDLGVGLVRDLGPRSRVFVSFHEDLISHTGPDVTLQAGWSWGR